MKICRREFDGFHYHPWPGNKEVLIFAHPLKNMSELPRFPGCIDCQRKKQLQEVVSLFLPERILAFIYVCVGWDGT